MKQIPFRCCGQDTLVTLNVDLSVDEFCHCGIVEEKDDGVATIEIGSSQITIPSSFFILQTDGQYVDAVPVAKWQSDLALFSVDGFLIVNRIEDFNIKIDPAQHRWELPLIPQGKGFVIEKGLVIMSYPYKRIRKYL